MPGDRLAALIEAGLASPARAGARQPIRRGVPIAGADPGAALDADRRRLDD